MIEKNRNGWKQVMQETVQLGAVGILAKASNNGKTSSFTAGVADLSTKKPVNSDYRFRIGSVTKTFTATTVLQLVGENRLQLDVQLKSGYQVSCKEMGMMVIKLRYDNF